MGIRNINSHPCETLHSIGKINMGIRNINSPSPLNFTFNWEDQEVYEEYKFPPRLNFTFNWEDQHGD